ncbi:uncharacterized protein LOC106469175, partial [Limulus polyphemus]|uniref:Uncharacterized protein LOC106469175 n=1 Tax=Limulus polyphemus TaxID=6850 RepID=A0ABM1TBR3_LIMPO
MRETGCFGFFHRLRKQKDSGEVQTLRYESKTEIFQTTDNRTIPSPSFETSSSADFTSSSSAKAQFFQEDRIAAERSDNGYTDTGLLTSKSNEGVNNERHSAKEQNEIYIRRLNSLASDIEEDLSLLRVLSPSIMPLKKSKKKDSVDQGQAFN